MKDFYFKKFENRKPYQPVKENKFITASFQFFAVVTTILGFAYLKWRWTNSINLDAVWFAIPLVMAETLSFVGTILIFFNYWAFRDPEIKSPPHFLSEIEDLHGRPDRPLRIDINIATYNEDVELVRLSIQDAKKITYPFQDVIIKIFVLDDNRRDGRNPAMENMKAIATEEGVEYLCREDNEGFKAGNLKNGLEHSNGDLFVILDADTRAFPTFLNNTAGYFKNKKVAWVQTPQWFYDTNEGIYLNKWIRKKIKFFPEFVYRIFDRTLGKMKIGEDIFGNDGRLFYDVILRKRNYHNAAFCCGAGSIHRREALMSLAVKDFLEGIKSQLESKKEVLTNQLLFKELKRNLILKQKIIPFKFHASEDIYTSIMLHADRINNWESIQHPFVECKMLSTQDLDSWVKQHSRYASGSLDIAFNDNPVFRNGLTFSQKVCYFNTIWSYFAPLWLIVFLLSPVVFFFTHALPVQAHNFDFLKYFIPFQILNSITLTLGCWGIPTKRGDQYYISCFWMMLMSLFSVLIQKRVQFNVTPKGLIFGNNFQHIAPHIIIIGLTIAGICLNIYLAVTEQHPSLSGFVSNLFWSLFNIYNLSIMVRAAFWTMEDEEFKLENG